MPPPAEGFTTRIVLGPALRTQPDRRLVTLVRSGYETAFEEIVRRYGKPLTRYAAAIVGSRGEDVVQDSFSKALLALRRDGAEIELRPWLFRIVRNTALNDLRDNPPSAEELATAIAGGGNPAEELERREELTDLITRLQSLPEPQRAAIVMRELEGLSHEEIAAALGLSGGGARQAIYRARQALREGLGMLLPLPLLKLLIDHGGEAAIAGVGAGAGASGAAAAGGALGGGAGVALKAGVVTAVLAGSVGTGIALREDRGRSDGPAAAAAAAGTTVKAPASAAVAPQPTGTASGNVEDSSGQSAGDRGRGPGGDKDDRGRDREHGGEDDLESSGPGPGKKTRRPEDRHGDRRGPNSHGHDHGGRGHGERGGLPGLRHGSSGPGGGHSGPEPGDRKEGERGGSNSGPGGGREERGLEDGDGSTGPLPPPPPAGESGSGEAGESSGPGSGESGDSAGEGRESDESP
jgi:RNA polymerase sigma factor (sigma-70 family)